MKYNNKIYIFFFLRKKIKNFFFVFLLKYNHNNKSLLLWLLYLTPAEGENKGRWDKS